MQSLVRFSEEVDEYLRLKGKTTRAVYSSAFELFQQYYQTKYGKGKGFSEYLDNVFAELKKPRREQRRIAEIELVDFVDYLKELGKSNNTIRLHFAAVQNFLKYKGIMVSSTFIGNLPPPVEKARERAQSLEAYITRALFKLEAEKEFEVSFQMLWDVLLNELGIPLEERNKDSIEVPLLGYKLSKKAVGGRLSSVFDGQAFLRHEIGRTWKFKKAKLERLAKKFAINELNGLYDVREIEEDII